MERTAGLSEAGVWRFCYHSQRSIDSHSDLCALKILNNYTCMNVIDPEVQTGRACKSSTKATQRAQHTRYGGVLMVTSYIVKFHRSRRIIGGNECVYNPFFRTYDLVTNNNVTLSLQVCTIWASCMDCKLHAEILFGLSGISKESLNDLLFNSTFDGNEMIGVLGHLCAHIG